jgi:hypothetical protein
MRFTLRYDENSDGIGLITKPKHKQLFRELSNGRVDSDTFRAINRFLGKFNDGHVFYIEGVLSDSSRVIRLPFAATPVEDKFLLSDIDADYKKVTRGDELVSIDGIAVNELAQAIDNAQWYAVPNPATQRHFLGALLTRRPFSLQRRFLPLPGTNARVVLRRADGTSYTLNVPWENDRPPPRLSSQAPAARPAIGPQAQGVLNSHLQDLMRTTKGEIALVGADKPFFITEASQRTFNIKPVRPTVATMKEFGVVPCAGSETETFDCYKTFAGQYIFGNKRILLVRIPSYVPAEGVSYDPRYIKAIMKDFQSTSDVLVIDETNNPGGAISLATDYLSWFISEPKTNLGLAFHADRRQISDFRRFASEIIGDPDPLVSALGKLFDGYSLALERAYDSRQELAPLLPLEGYYSLEHTPPPFRRVLPDSAFTWRKPVLVLANELSLSTGDMFPLLVKSTRAAPIFGARMAGLGGSVEPVAKTTYSEAELYLTRSLCAPLDEQNQIPLGALTEDNGVAPDIEYRPTVADFRAGYVDYVRAFSSQAVRLTRP